jgi:hypothetical protein
MFGRRFAKVFQRGLECCPLCVVQSTASRLLGNTDERFQKPGNTPMAIAQHSKRIIKIAFRHLSNSEGHQMFSSARERSIGFEFQQTLCPQERSDFRRLRQGILRNNDHGLRRTPQFAAELFSVFVR